MRIIAIKVLREFWLRRPDAEQALRTWHEEVSRAQWSSPAEIKAQYAHASILKERRVVFNIKGNDFRLVASVAYQTKIVFVKFVGSHAEYDRIDAETIEQE